MKLAFSTLGCPQWGLDQIVDAATALGYDAIELRALGGTLDLLGRPELQPEAIGATRRHLDESGLVICCVDTSCSFHAVERAERRTQVALAIRHCELAASLGAPLIRVFPDTVPSGATRDETRDRIASALAEIAHRVPEGVRVGLETHGDFARAAAAVEVVRLANHPSIVVIWDVANSVAAGDGIAEAADVVAPYLAHVHLRDARPVADREHWLPVLAGRGLVSFEATAEALARLEFDGTVSFEWEKHWHPEIEEPEVALPDFMRAVRRAFRRIHERI